MKKIIYLLTSFCVLNQLYAQNATANKNTQLKNRTTIVSEQSIKVYPDKDLALPVDENSFYAKTNARAGGDLVGNTTYDLPSNASSPGRLLVYDDGKVTVAWTGSTSMDAARPDRGTYYNHYDGSTWGIIPDTRIESYRTGFPSIINVEGHEMFFVHDGLNNIGIFENAAPGSAVWTENSNSLDLKGTWPRAACAEGSSYIHLLVANDDAANQNEYTLYYRSPDGGATWDIQGYRLPGIDTASGYNVMGAESYTIRAIGSEVYVVTGDSYNDLAVWKSTSDGDIGSWARTRLIEWPIPNFDGNEISDMDGDGIADTVTTHDGSIALAIDKTGMMHVWTGVTYILDIEPDDAAWTYFPGVAGMWYWNESFGADSVQYLEFPLVDWDNDGDAFLGIGIDLPNYGIGFTSQPAVTLDESTGNMYVVYTQPVEYTDYPDDPEAPEAQSFRDLFGFYTTDAGLSWSSPINLSYQAESNYENINPTLYWNTVDDKVHVIWQQDQEPGNSLETEAPDPITADNNIIYRAYDYSRFEPYDPSADFAYTTTLNSVDFTNLSVDASTYLWDFGDGGFSSSREPVHAYTATGSYTVCLTATNVYGESESCKTVDITEVVNVADVTLENNILVYPTLANDFINIQANNLNGVVFAEFYNLQGQKLFESTITGNQTFDISAFSAGEYLIRFFAEGAIANKRFTIGM